MNASSRLSGYVAVLRKHVVLLTVSVALVITSGFVYLWRQPVVYEADALLLIEQPMPNLLGRGPTRNYFAISQAALNTELYLLREDTVTSSAAIERVRGAGVDPEAAGYTPEGLAASVTVSQVPGTEGLVRFALTGGDAESLPRMVQCYAEEYSRRAVASRSEQFELQLSDLRQRVEVARAALEEREKARDEFARKHTELNLERGENPYAAKRAALENQIPALEQQALADVQALRRINEALDDVAVTVEYDATGDARLTGLAPAQALHGALADSALVAGLPAVRRHPEVVRLREVESAALARDRGLAEQGFLEGDERRRAAAEDLRAARERRGWLTTHALELELTEVAARTAHLADVRARLAAAEQAEEELNRLLGEYQELQRDVAGRLREYEEHRGRLSDFTSMFLTTAAGPSGDGATAHESAEPRLRISVKIPPRSARQVAPKVPLVIGMTLAAAFAVGLGLVFMFEYLDDTIRSKEDFDRYLGLPFLGFVPRISVRDHENPDLAAESAPGSAAAEAFRAVRTSILFSRVDRPVKTMLVTSAGPGEGKTTVATNLATTFARKKGPVLLVDADLRKPRVAKALGLEPGPGLSDVLIGAATLEEVARSTQVEGLHAIASGPIPPNPAELLHGERMAEFLEQAARHYECVVLDTPPLIAVSDARVLASRVDGLYLVISMGRTSRRLIQRAVESLTSIGFDVDGAILNNMSGTEDTYGAYAYYAQE